jgi:hypothetical protein
MAMRNGFSLSHSFGLMPFGIDAADWDAAVAEAGGGEGTTDVVAADRGGDASFRER